MQKKPREQEDWGRIWVLLATTPLRSSVIPKKTEEAGYDSDFGEGYTARCFWYNASGIDTAIQVQIMDEVVCILLSANTFGKGMNPSHLSPQATGKYYGRLVSVALVKQLTQNKYLNQTPLLLHLKSDIESYLALAECWINTKYYYN